MAKNEKTKGFWSVGRLVLGIMAMVFAMIVLFQSCAAGVANTLDDSSSDMSGSVGFFLAMMMIAGGIVGICTRNGGKTGPIVSAVLFGLGGLLGLSGMNSIFKDLIVWGVVCLCIGTVFAICAANTHDDVRHGNKKPIYKRVWFIILCAFLMLCCIGTIMSSNDKTSESPNTNGTKQEQEATKEKDADKQIIYAEDTVVNQFITTYNALTQSKFSDIERGNIRTKYFAYSYGYHCEMLHAADTDKIHVYINETNDNSDVGVVGMRDVFHDVAKTIDSSLSDEEVYEYFDKMVNEEEYIKNGKLGSMTILYVPDGELSYGHLQGHIEISAL